jgi:phage shock protein PspC (stress-responsive transcriptional regulator)
MAMKEKTEVYQVSYTSVIGTRQPAKAPEVTQKQDERILRNANTGFVWVGLGTLAAGTFLALTSILPTSTFVGVSLPTAVAVTGVAALGLGLLSLYKHVFVRKKLNLPSLTIRRKTEANEKSIPATPVDNSSFNRVFFGVAGGIANSTGLPATLIRFLLVGGFFATAGLLMIVYLILAMAMPPEKRGERLLEEPQRNPGPR